MRLAKAGLKRCVHQRSKVYSTGCVWKYLLLGAITPHGNPDSQGLDHVLQVQGLLALVSWNRCLRLEYGGRRRIERARVTRKFGLQAVHH